MKSAVLLNRIKELSFDAKIEPVSDTKTSGSPAQLAFLEHNYFSREEHGPIRSVDTRRGNHYRLWPMTMSREPMGEVGHAMLENYDKLKIDHAEAQARIAELEKRNTELEKRNAE